MIEKLSYSIGKKDEKANIDLAIELVQTKNKEGISEIVDGLSDKNENIAGDCVKVLYEAGEREPALIAEYADEFIALLNSKNNRLVWGGMTALSKIAYLKADVIFKNLDVVVKAYEKGSVITVDNSISVFAALVKADKEYARIVFPIIISHLEKCRPKEVGQHSERAFVCVNKDTADVFKRTSVKRRNILAEPQKKRVDKILKMIDEEKFIG